MAFPDHLLELAQDLRSLHSEGPHQASLRRAVSTAYYALFHLLISEATANWTRPELRAILGRCFDRGPMKTASETKVSQVNAAFKDNPPERAEKTVDDHLRTVANAFIQAQQRRNDADYNMAKDWITVEVGKQIASVNEAFKTWDLVAIDVHRVGRSGAAFAGDPGSSRADSTARQCSRNRRHRTHGHDRPRVAVTRYSEHLYGPRRLHTNESSGW